MNQSVAIIGSGIAGLASALRLRAAGFDVTVYEQQSWLGGKLHTVEQDGFYWDAGPSFLTQPWRLTELFALFGESIDDYLDIVPVDPSVCYIWPNRQSATTPRDHAALVQQLASLDDTDPRRVDQFLHHIASDYERIGGYFVDNDISKPGFWWSPRTLRRISGSAAQLTDTMHGYHRRWFPESPRLVQLFDRYATYGGNNPYHAPAFLSAIADVELRQGIFYPRGGLRRIAKSLVDVGKKHGVAYRTDSPVTAVHVGRHHIDSITINQQPIAANLFVSAIDPVHTARLLNRTIPQRNPSTSALIWFWGVESSTRLGLHTVLFSRDSANEFAAIEHGTISSPTIYINNSSAIDAHHAPDGKQNWFVMINAPADNGQNWPQFQRQIGDTVQQTIAMAIGEQFSITTSASYHPGDIAQTSGAWQGSIYAASTTNVMDLFKRQPPRDRQYRNLFYCGGGSHPGGGMPMCLASAAIVTDAVQQRRQR